VPTFFGRRSECQNLKSPIGSILDLVKIKISL
jgi:hypothetical protein